MRSPDVSEQDIIEAGISIAQGGGPVSGSRIRTLLGGGNVARLKRIWDAHIAAQEKSASRLAALPHETSTLMEKATESVAAIMLQLTHQTNDVAAKDVQQQVVREVASARMQQEALQRELNDAAGFLDDVEAQLNTTRCECVAQAELLAVTQARLQSLATENARLKERLKAAKAAGASVRVFKSNVNAARAEVASITGRLEEAQAVNKQLIASRA